MKTENVWGVEESAANKGSLRLQHFTIIGHCNCLLLGYLWAQHLCYLYAGVDMDEYGTNQI